MLNLTKLQKYQKIVKNAEIAKIAKFVQKDMIIDMAVQFSIISLCFKSNLTYRYPPHHSYYV